MVVNQVYSLLTDINHQMFGDTALQVNDLQGVISMGQTVMSGSTDAFWNQLIDRIGKVIVRKLDAELQFPNLMRNEFEWGCAIQKLTVDVFDPIENSDWNISSGGFTPTLLDGDTGTIYQTFFTSADTWAIQRKFPENILFTAFTSAEAFGAFAEAVAAAFMDSMTISINNMARTAINNFMAEKIKAGNGVINIADLYNATSPATPVTHASDALLNKDFLRFSTNVIRKYMKYLSVPNVNYNVAGRLRATQRDNLNFFCLTEYIASLESFLDSDTWHNEFVDIGEGGFTEVPYWQANLDSNADVNEVDCVSAIKVTPSSEAGQLSPTDVEQSGIIALMADRQAIFTGIEKRRAAAFYNPIDDYTVTKMSATIQYANDTSENGLVFIIEPTPGP